MIFVSSINCHASQISKFVSHYLQPHAETLPSYDQEATDFIKNLRTVKGKSKDSILVTLDVRELYEMKL